MLMSDFRYRLRTNKEHTLRVLASSSLAASSSSSLSDLDSRLKSDLDYSLQQKNRVNIFRELFFDLVIMAEEADFDELKAREVEAKNISEKLEEISGKSK